MRLAAGQRGGLLADMDVAEADAVQQREHVAHARHHLEKFERFLDRHVEHVGDRLALEQHLQRFAVVALALADVAGDVDVGQKVHLDLDDAIALAGLAAAAFDVEGEAAGLVAARLGFGQAGEQFADRREGARIGGRVGARRAADRRLVDVDDLVEMLDAFDAVERGGGFAGAVEAARQRLVERVDHKVDLPEPETPVMQVKSPKGISAVTFFRLLPRAPMSLSVRAALIGAPLGHGDLARAGEILAGERARIGHDVHRRALGDDARRHARRRRGPDRPRSRRADGVFVMLDDDDGVAEVAQPLERVEQACIVALVQADRGLVQHVEHADEAGADLRGEPDALASPPESVPEARDEREIFEADIDQEFQPRADLFENAAGDLVLLGVEFLRQVLEPVRRGLYGKVGDFADMPFGDLDAQRFGFEPVAMAGFAGHVGEVAAISSRAHSLSVSL